MTLEGTTWGLREEGIPRIDPDIVGLPDNKDPNKIPIILAGFRV